MLKVAWDPIYCHPLPDGHRFPMEKYDLLPELLMREGTLQEEHLFRPTLLADEVLKAPHDPEYYARLLALALTPAEIRRTGFPLSHELVSRERVIMSGTVACALFALQHGCSINVAGGTHHAFTDRGEGFCLLNGIGIGAQYLLDRGLAQQVLVIDLDVHQGNGTAQMFAHQSRVFTFSMHGANNYPMHKEQSDYDIPLRDGTDDGHYLRTLRANLEPLLDRVKPDFVMYQAGVDILETDKLGRMKVTLGGCAQRDKLVLTACKARNIPVCITMGGGYSPKIADILEAHANTYRLAQDVFF